MSINSTRDKLNIQEMNVIFSFDDCPDIDTTPLLLNLLAKYNIKAFFCLLGTNAHEYPEIVKRIYDEGHLFINHGFYDKWNILMNDEEFTTNLKLGEETISSILGFYPQPKLFRPHGGYYNNAQEQIITNEGWTIIPANIRVYDAASDSKRQSYIIKKTIDLTIKERGGIILLHDALGGHDQKEKKLKINPQGPSNRLWIVHSVDEIITSLLKKGFILHHNDLLQASGLNPEDNL